MNVVKYVFKSAVCLARTIGSQWETIDISNILVYNIFNTYSKVYLVLTHTSVEGTFYVDMDTLKAKYSMYNNTLSTLLDVIGDTTLEYVDNIPSTEIKYAKYSDAVRSEYKISVTKIGYQYPENYPLSELTDLKITRPKYSTDLRMIHNYCLVSVNGYYHMTDTDGTNAYIKDGRKSLDVCNQNNVGILSFLDIGKLTKVKLTESDIFKQEDTSTLKDRIYIKTDQDLTDKSVFLCLGGYLVFPEDQIFWQVGDHTFALDIKKIPYIQRIFESRGFIDLTDLKLSKLAITDDSVNLDELYSDEVIKRYLMLSQSFLVIVDSKNLTTKKMFIRDSGLAGMYTSYMDPVYPLIVGYGRTAEYWKVLEDGHWSVTVTDPYLRNYLATLQRLDNFEIAVDHLVPMRPAYISKGFLLEISGFQ